MFQCFRFHHVRFIHVHRTGGGKPHAHIHTHTYSYTHTHIHHSHTYIAVEAANQTSERTRLCVIALATPPVIMTMSMHTSIWVTAASAWASLHMSTMRSGVVMTQSA